MRRSIKKCRQLIQRHLRYSSHIWLDLHMLPISDGYSAREVLAELEDEFDFVEQAGGWYISERGRSYNDHHHGMPSEIYRYC